jgi:hypothetical protein
MLLLSSLTDEPPLTADDAMIDIVESDELLVNQSDSCDDLEGGCPLLPTPPALEFGKLLIWLIKDIVISPAILCQ